MPSIFPPVAASHQEIVFPVAVADKLVVEPGQTTEGVALTFVGVTAVLIVIVTLAHVVVLHEPCALTQYVVATVGVTVTDIPDARYVPPHEPVNQFQFEPATKVPPVSVSELLIPLQTEDGFALIEMGAIFPVTVIIVLKHPVVLQGPSALAQ